MMDYYDHDERERKQMYHSSGPVRIYRAGLDESEDGECSGGRSGKGNGGGSGGGSGRADGGGINGAAEITEIDINYY